MEEVKEETDFFRANTIKFLSVSPAAIGSYLDGMRRARLGVYFSLRLYSPRLIRRENKWYLSLYLIKGP